MYLFNTMYYLAEKCTTRGSRSADGCCRRNRVLPVFCFRNCQARAAHEPGDAQLAPKITRSESHARPRAWIEDASAKAKRAAG